MEKEPINTIQIQRLNELIESKQISKADMSRIAGVSKQAVNGWFTRGVVGKNSAIKLANAFGVSLEWILGHEVGEKSGIKPDEMRLLELYRQLPEDEKSNIQQVISLRLKKLDEIYEKYILSRVKGSED